MRSSSIIPAIGSMLVMVIALTVLSNRRTFGRDEGLPIAQGQAHKPAWLEGSGKDLRIKITGEVLDETGAPANGYKLEARLSTSYSERDLPVVLQGNRFGVWVPVGSADWFTLHVSATSADARQIAQRQVSTHEVRQAAIDGLVLRMNKPERSIEVKVVESGRAVPDASVAAEFAGERVIRKTNTAGIATFPAMNRDKLSQLTAWTNDFKIGGYQLSRDPPRDPLGSEFTVNLDGCRPQKVRIVNDEDKTPVADLGFVLFVGTGPPNHQFVGRTPDCQMTTDKNGEAVYRWFPDWKKHGSVVEVSDPHWIKVADEQVVDGVILVRVRKRQFDKRRRITGIVTSPAGNVAGFSVSISSFQGEEKNRDVLSTFADAHGKFTADYLPGATYWICVNDARFVSKIVDLIPYEPTTGKTSVPSLNVSTGQPVEIVVTSGPSKRPIAHQDVQLEIPHVYSWRAGGRTQSGIGGRRWWVTTDEQGKAYTFALPGQRIDGSIYSAAWRSQESVEVKSDGVTRLEFHQQVAAKRKVVGRLLCAGNVQANLNEAVVQVGSVDGETKERLTLKTKADGEFAFDSQASRIGIYACTKDSRAATVSIIDRLDRPIELRLKPTGEYRGQLLGKDNRPLQGHMVRAVLFVSGSGDYSKPFPTQFSAARFECKTDGAGNYSLTGLPCEVALSLCADSIDGSGGESDLGKFYLVPNKSRPRAVSRLWEPPVEIMFAERYEKTLRDCRLSDFRAMVILFRPSNDTNEFVDGNLMDYHRTKEVASFMQLQGQVDDAASAEIAGFARSKGWPIPEKGRIFACAVDPAGKELGRIEFDSKDPDGPTLAAQFIRKHAPNAVDAREKWDKAFAVARQTNRKVWVRVSERYCGSCFLLARWLDDQRKALEQDYVLLKIDDVRDLHGDEVAKRVTGDGHYGLPFHAIFDADGRMLINSASARGNVGYPSGFEGKKHLRRMLMETRGRLTDKQVEEIIASLPD